jgi:hypothetical protein
MSFDWWPRNSGKWIDLGKKLTVDERCALNDLADQTHKLDAAPVDDDARVAGMIGRSVRAWRKIKVVLIDNRAIKITKGRIYIPLLMEAMARKKAVSDANRKGGIASGIARQKQASMPDDRDMKRGSNADHPVLKGASFEEHQRVNANVRSTTTLQDSSSRRTTTAVTEADLAVGLRLKASESEIREAVIAMEEWAIAKGQTISNRAALLRKFILDARANKRRALGHESVEVDAVVAKPMARVFDDSIHWDGECDDETDDEIPF